LSDLFVFWNDVEVELNDYSNDKEEYGESTLKDANIQLFKDEMIDPSNNFPNQSWEILCNMFIAVQKDYKVKYQC
jgi:hypothetical protein